MSQCLTVPETTGAVPPLGHDPAHGGLIPSLASGRSGQLPVVKSELGSAPEHVLAAARQRLAGRA